MIGMMLIRTYLIAGAVGFLPGTYSGTSICNPLPGIITHPLLTVQESTPRPLCSPLIEFPSPPSPTRKNWNQVQVTHVSLTLTWLWRRGGSRRPRRWLSPPPRTSSPSWSRTGSLWSAARSSSSSSSSSLVSSWSSPASLLVSSPLGWRWLATIQETKIMHFNIINE